MSVEEIQAYKIKRLESELLALKKQKTNAEKRLDRQETNLNRVFNSDQMHKLSLNSTQGSKWSDDSIKRGLQLKFACGRSGYELLVLLNTHSSLFW